MTRDAICEGMRAARAKETSRETEWRSTARWFSLSFIGRVRVEKHTDEKKERGPRSPAFSEATARRYLYAESRVV